jgi:predicted neuraminidase
MEKNASQLKMQKFVVSTKGKRLWQGIPGIEVTPIGKLWACFYSGGKKEPDPKNQVLTTYSNDAGKSWSSPKVVVDIEGSARAFDPTLWHDPDGKLWLIYNHGDIKKNQHYICYTTTTDSESDNPTWSKPQKMDIDIPIPFRMNKPIALSSGEWLSPLSWAPSMKKKKWLPRYNYQGVVISHDKGQSWSAHGKVEALAWALENMMVELQDGTIWMLIRAGGGTLWESYSTDRGVTWSEGQPTEIVNPGSRFFIGRLKSGKILLINQPLKKGRTGMYVAFSEDDGKTFSKPLMIDERENVSYPDAVEDAEGNIHIVYDRLRYEVGEINYVCLKEK